jgi:cobalt-zinc-cadmium efflux system membrane fusion protein
MRFVIAAALGAVALGMVFCGAPLQAHEGHDHAEQQAAPVSSSHAARAEARSDQFELVAVVRKEELSIYLDRAATNEPVEGAVIEVETPAGPLTATARPGDAYRLAGPWLSKPGQVDLIFTVTAGDVTEILPLSLTLPETTAAAVEQESSSLTAAGEGAGKADRALLVIAGVAGVSFLLGLLLASRGRSRAAHALVLLSLSAISLAGTPAWAHEGEDHSEPAAAVAPSKTGELAQRLPEGGIFVPKATQRIFAVRTTRTEETTHRRSIELPGRVIPDPNASGLVQAAVGGRLSPPEGGFPQLGAPVNAGTVLAYVTPPLQSIDLSDMRQRQGELDQQIAIVQRRLTRYEALAPNGAVPRSQLDEARLELAGLKDRRAALDRIRRDAEPLVAPVSGVVADANAVAGQMAQPDSVVFQIVDPVRMWVEALSFERIGGTAEASAKTSNGEDVRLSYRGAGYADRNQSIPVHFSIDGQASRLRPGQFVTVLVATDREKKGIAIPRGSVVRTANGQTVVFEHSSAEIFEARPVRVEPLDGDRVLVSSGLTPGKRIVTQGAELLDQVR